ILIQYKKPLAHIVYSYKSYHHNIHIDDYTLTHTSIGFRSELIRVIQEAFTNIVKHAKATRVDLLVYKETEKLFVIIKDNGKGLNSITKQNALGINSMKKRLRKFDAAFSLRNDGSGVEIIISIPENNIKQAS